VAPFVYGTRSIRTRDYTETRTRWLFFSKDRRKVWAREGQSSRFTHFWPFLHIRKDRSGSLEAAFPSVFPVLLEKVERNWPFFTLFRYERDHQGRVDASFLWNLFTYEADEHSSFMELAYIFEYSTDKRIEAQSFSLFKGLFAYRRLGDRTRYSFLYLPWGIETGPAVAQKPKPRVITTAGTTARKTRQRIIFESVH
jgi:hypothetical protein